MPLNTNAVIPPEASRSQDSDSIILNGERWILEQTPYCPEGLAYFVPVSDSRIIDSAPNPYVGTIVTYSDPRPGNIQYNIERLRRLWETELLREEEKWEYSVITMGNEGEYLPIRFDEEYI